MAARLALAALCLVASAVCAQPAEMVRIGFASPLTGPQAHCGKDNQNGALLAIEKLNALSG